VKLQLFLSGNALLQKCLGQLEGMDGTRDFMAEELMKASNPSTLSR
jgi:hypothetical protein